MTDFIISLILGVAIVIIVGGGIGILAAHLDRKSRDRFNRDTQRSMASYRRRRTDHK